VVKEQSAPAAPRVRSVAEAVAAVVVTSEAVARDPVPLLAVAVG